MHSERLRSILLQGLVLACVIAGLVGLGLNAAANLRALGLASGFGFLEHRAGFDIAFTVLPYDRSDATYLDVLLVGITNTLAVSLVGIVLATVLGVTIGVLQLLGNWPLTRLCRSYIELVRNIPLLVQLLAWYTLTLTMLPHQRDSLSFLDLVFLNVRGLYVPTPVSTAGTAAFLVALGLGLAFWVAWARRASRRRLHEGREGRAHSVGLPVLLILASASIVAFGNPFDWDVPTLRGFNFQGGSWLPPEFVALLFGLTIYTAAFIAELVRGGISAIPAGQREAATGMGLTKWQVMKLVMIPQALRIIIPPLTSQYLNLIKNSSLAVAIAYPDIVSVFTGTALNQTGRAIEIVALTMGFYLAISLIVSGLMNWYNARVKLVSRA